MKFLYYLNLSIGGLSIGLLIHRLAILLPWSNIALFCFLIAILVYLATIGLFLFGVLKWCEDTFEIDWDWAYAINKIFKSEQEKDRDRE